MNTKLPDANASSRAAWTTPVATSATVLSVLSASCCVLPVALSIAGFGGAWLGMLGPFVAWRGPILAFVGVVLLGGWIAVLRRRGSGRMAMGIASIMFVLALSAPQWERETAQALWSHWKASP